jgi:hypothetical protein
MNVLALWDHVLDHLQANGVALDQWRHQYPNQLSDRDLLEEYGWVVVSCGLTPHVSFKLWPSLTEAFRSWNPAAILERECRTAALSVLKSARKIDAILQMAESLRQEPGQMARLAAMPVKEALASLGTLPWVGPTNRYHMARNIGFDLCVRTGPVVRLAAYLNQAPEELCGEIAALTGERLRTVDLAIWKWCYDVGDDEAKRWAGLFRLMGGERATCPADFTPPG